MKEKIVNLFLFVNKGVIREIGATWHDAEGSDEQKIAFLQGQVHNDWKTSTRYPLSKNCIIVVRGKSERGAISYETFFRLAGLGKQIEILEDTVFSKCESVPRSPLTVITCIVDGAVKIEAIVGPLS